MELLSKIITGGVMNDYWNYLEHGLKGKERKSHKYYARAPTGTINTGKRKP